MLVLAALTRLFWVVVRVAARRLALLAAAVINKAVDMELAADRGLKARRPVVVQRPAGPAPPPVRRVQPSARERALATYAGQEGVGIFVVTGDRAAIIHNAGRC